MEPKEMAELAVKALDSKKGRDIRMLRTTELTFLADWFVICTAGSTTHVKTLTEEVDRQLSEAGASPFRREGHRSDRWVLLDFGSLVVHVFLPDAREFYNLERLWADAEEVDLSSLIGP